jgi:hypothetical protein
MKRILLVPLVLAIALSTGCSKKEAPPPAQPARVSATPAYEKYFGPAPTSDKGSCFAFVIYFPSAREPGRVVPFPFFTFDEGSMEKVAVERLLAGMDVPAYRAEIAQPFTPGARLLTIEQVDGLKRVDLSGGFLAVGADQGGMLHAVVMTLTQFREVRGVRLLQAGKDLDYARGPQKPEESWVMEPGPPRLLSVTAMKDKGAKEVEEVNAFFDRPVDIRELHLSDRNGRPFAGDTYHAVFDMAAVLKPKDPSPFKAGMMVRARWKVADKLGREAEGDEVRPLEVKVHEQ